MYTLLIDGNFFLRRIHSISGLTFLTNPDKDRIELLEKLSQSFSATLRKHEKYIDNVIMVRDYGSWRKHTNVIKPLELITDESVDQDYKDNRTHDETTDWSKVYGCFDELCDVLSTKFMVPIIKQHRAEGDDLLYIISRVLNVAGKKVLLWTSDGDMVQVVNEHTILFRMPKEIVYVTKSAYEARHSDMSIFNTSVDLLDVVIANGSAVSFTNATTSIIDKIIKGDPKDNVPPLFCWKGGSTNRKPNNTHIKKAFAELDIDLSTLDYEKLYDDEFITKLITLLLKYAKQERDVEHTINVFKSNRKLLCLNNREIPLEILTESTNTFKSMSAMRPVFSRLNNPQNIMNELGVAKDTGFFSQFSL